MANFEYGMLSQGFVPKRLVDIKGVPLLCLRTILPTREEASA